MVPGPGDTARQPALWNGFANMSGLAGHAVTIARGEGASVFDTDGRAYLDALASLWYCNVGHGRGELADAAAEQMRRLAAYQVFEPFTNPPAEELARRVADLAPLPGAKVFFTPGGGSDAVDTAAKLARAYWRAVDRPGKQIGIARSAPSCSMVLSSAPGSSHASCSMRETSGRNVPEALDRRIEELGADRVAAFFC